MSEERLWQAGCPLNSLVPFLILLGDHILLAVPLSSILVSGYVGVVGFLASFQKYKESKRQDEISVAF